MGDDHTTTNTEDATISPLASLTPDPRNARKHDERNLTLIETALREVGAARSIVVDETGVVLAGNATVAAAERAGLERVITVDADGETIIAVRRSGLTDEQKAKLALYDNRTAELAAWDTEVLASLAEEVDLSELWRDDELAGLLATLEAEPLPDLDPTDSPATLAARFLVPPFSVLDARQGYWQERKRAWLALGIQSELGRGDVMPSGESSVYGGSSPWAGQRGPRRANAAPGGSPRPAATLGPDGKTVRGDGRGRGLARRCGQDLMKGEHVVGSGRRMHGRPPHGPSVTRNPDGTLAYSATNAADGQSSGTSVFDPVLCELAYRWFCPPAGTVLDPFAGGSVRGIVAHRLGRRYVGVDLSERQVAANAQQAATITPGDPPIWHVGDARDVRDLAGGSAPVDFLFSCPPYADLEVYSDDPRDLSTLAYPDFLVHYRQIIAAALSLLAEDRFACFVVGDVRDPQGLYRNLVSETIAAFHDAGARLYNEAILVTAVGSLPIRVGRQFESARKLGKTHQNVLVFVKGDARKATKAIGPVEVADVFYDDEEVTS